MKTMFDWITSIWKILISPIPNTFINESKKAKGKLVSAIIWTLFLVAYNYVLNFLLFKREYSALVIGFSFLLYPITVLFFVFLLNLVYRKLFHRKKSYYDEFLYFTVIDLVLYYLIVSLVLPIPKIGITLSWILGTLYPVILLTIGVISLTKLKIWEAVVTVLISITIGIAGFLCIPGFISSLVFTLPQVIGR